MATVFISYRRDDSAGWAGRLATDLMERFGPEAVFQDIDAIEAGEDFLEAIGQALSSCSAALVLIGPDWSIIKGKDGRLQTESSPRSTVQNRYQKNASTCCTGSCFDRNLCRSLVYLAWSGKYEKGVRVHPRAEYR